MGGLGNDWRENFFLQYIIQEKNKLNKNKKGKP